MLPIGLSLMVLPLPIVQADMQAQPTSAACTPSQVVRLNRPAIQADLTAAGIGIDVRQVTLFVKFKPNDISFNEVNTSSQPRNCTMELSKGSGDYNGRAIYLTPDRYINVRPWAQGDLVESRGFTSSPTLATVRFGKISSLSYEEDKVRSGLLSLFIKANDKYSYYIQYRVW